MADLIERLQEALADRYRIERELGSGGMAIVYLAEDIKHQRRVAIKILQPELAAVIGGDRFLREIRIAANLNHPHILPLHDSGQTNGFLYYVMPYVEGESLRDKLNRETQLSIEEAIRITQQAASALEAAHGEGVIHRDIKPENILLQKGEVLVADFGIALAVRAAGGQRLTESGLSLGTPQYMSPEQASADRHIDARTDIYSLGSVLYEMLVGEPPFTGPNVQAIIAKLLSERAPGVRSTRDTVPPAVEHTVMKTLAKLPADRFATAREFADTLTRASTPGVAFSGAAFADEGDVSWQRRLLRVLPWGAVALMTAMFLVALWGPWRERPRAATTVTRFEISLPEGDTLWHSGFPNPIGTPVAISPDGTVLAYVASREGIWRLYWRRIDELDAQPIAGTEGAFGPFFSADGNWISFFADRWLKKVPLAGGDPQVVVETGSGMRGGGSWGANDTIIFSNFPDAGLWKVAAAGGAAEQLTNEAEHFEGTETWHLLPEILPGERAVLFSGYEGYAVVRVGVLQLSSGEVSTLIAGASSARWMQTGHLVFSRASDLFAVPFDVQTLEITGTEFPVVPGVRDGTQFAVSANGTLVFVPGTKTQIAVRPLLWVNRRGETRTVDLQPGCTGSPRISPDGRRLACFNDEASQNTSGIWVYELETGRGRKLTDEGGDDYWLLWTPDGDEVVFTSNRHGGSAVNLYRIRADGGGTEVRLTTSNYHQQPQSWSADGKTLVFTESGPGYDIWMIPREGDGEAQRVLQGRTGSTELHPTISPDGNWLAYASDESGPADRYEVYIRPFPGPGPVTPVSTGGGVGPLWDPDGGTLYYRAQPSGALIAVAFSVTMNAESGGSEISLGEPEELFDHDLTRDVWGRQYDVSADGQHFAFFKAQKPEVGATKINVVLNWFEVLTGRVGR